MIGVVDYGAGNITSVLNMLKRIGCDAEIVSDEEGVSNSHKLILPGVGHFSYGMQQLSERKLIEPIKNHSIIQSKPLLGICLGAQLLGTHSEEGNVNGLGIVDFNVKKFVFNSDEGEKIPHMGWSEVSIKKESELFKDHQEIPRFYFVHSYYMSMKQESDTLTTTHYGFEFTSSFEKDNVFGVQFHPEKSHVYGMKLLQNFVEIK